MFGGIVKKILGKSDKKDTGAEKMAISLRARSEKLTQFLGDKFQLVQDEISDVREKAKNLRETNYNLGLKHLENGRLTDAIFRFRLIKKFWPDLFDAYYQLAYCLVLDDKLDEAKKVLEELLTKNPDYDQKAYDLLESLSSTESDE